MLSIIIVNYRSAALVLDCLHALYAAPGDHPFELFVVDNASGDDSERLVMSAFPQVKWIQMGYNSGFGRANNEGIRQSSGEAVLLLNSDTLPDAGTVGACYRRLMSSGHAGAGIQLLNRDGTPQISGNYIMKGGLNYLLPLPYLGNFIKNAGELAKVKKPHVPNATDTVEVDWINGAFLMVKKDAIHQAGLLDEDFFLYAEEPEWCSRLKKAGGLCIFGDLRMVHLQGETANQEFGSTGKGYYNLYDRKGLQIMLSTFVRIRKEFGTGWFLVMLFMYILEIPVFLIGVSVSRLLRGGRSRYSFTQFGGYCKNIGFVVGKSLTIIRNKPYFYKVL